MNEPPLKILILRFSSIGDIVLTTPVMRNLKAQLEDVEIHYATKNAYKSILEANPYIDKIHTLGDSLNDLVKALRVENFNYVIDLHHNLRTLIIKTRLGIKAHSFDKLNRQKWLYVNFKVNNLPNRHIVDRYMDTIKPLGVEMDAFGLDYFIPDKDEVENSWLPETHQKGYVAFAIGGQFETKKLPVKRMIEVCDRINKPVILLGGKEDMATGEEITAFFEKKLENESFEKGLDELGKRTVIFNACGKFNLNQSASIVKNAKVVFSHDTGLMHIAAAFQKKVYSIWGNTSPHFGMYPYRTEFVIYENNKLKCRPCSKIGFKKCPKGHFKCMNDIVFDFWVP
jgi:ADP-heptose:LPS heptosyltransferase